MIQRWESPIKLSESNRWSCGTSALYTSAWDCFDLDNLFFYLPVQMSPDVNYPRHPVTFTFYDITSQHGDFDSLWNCLCQQSSVSISVAKWVKLRTTKPQVKSSNITGTFVFMKSNIFLKVDFPPQIEQFFPPFSRQMHTFTTKILTHHLYHPKRTQCQTHHCLPCILLEDTDWSLFCAFSVQLPAFSGAVCVIEMIFF